jgi:VWFA-related protein
VLQRVEQVEVESLPVNVINLYDVSGSVSGPAIARLRVAAETMIDQLQLTDRAALLTFSDDLRLLSTLSNDKGAAKGSLSHLTSGGRTRLRDAVFAGLALRDNSLGRTVAVVFSDGYDTLSWLSAGDVLEAAKRTDVVVYPVISNVGSSQGRGAVPFLKELAAETGGRLIASGSANELSKVFAEILEEFRHRYVLSFAPNPAGPGWHQLEVSLPRRRGEVTARKGYFLD